MRSSSADELRNFSRPYGTQNCIPDCEPRLNDLEQNARPSGCVKLAGEPDLYRIRVRDYRIIYQVNDLKLTVLVLAIGHRREVYRR
ncbi:MAG: type II toxin-antitoxin system mRNA interferase toxin, RelE/StbE family [Verrucomicrobia bacterium]|nr:MAG: type II toxin-antitoxin system mRNA interferase toxin, RelE/StbE family [Verrucomicrobiota bacterium]